MEQDNNWWLYPDKFEENLTKHRTEDTTWDYMFMRIAREIGLTLSKCASRQVGAILVKDRNIISIGFNGSPSGSSLCQDKKVICPRKKLGFPSGKGVEFCPAQHSEENTIAQAAKRGISTEGSTLYCYCLLPCQRCAGAIINAGIKSVVCLYEPPYDLMSEKLFREAHIKVYYIDASNIDKVEHE
jgi:dCMP deaminase